MYTVGLDVDTHSIMKIAGVIALKKYKNLPLSELLCGGEGTNYFSSHYISSPSPAPGWRGGPRAEIKDFSGLPTIHPGNSIEKISDHLKKHEKPSGEAEFGYYLAGLIEGNGYFGNKGLEILFFEKDITLAYYIKKRIGYGSVYRIKDKRTVKYVLIHPAGLKFVLDLVNGKFLTKYKIYQLLKHKYDKKFDTIILPPANFSLKTNHWLSGFTDSDGYFSISTPKDKFTKPYGDIRVRLRFVLGQKDPTILKKVKSEFGGYLYRFKSTDNYLLNLSSFSENLKVIEYFDKFNLNSIKYLAFFKWRKAYRIVQRKEHLTKKGLSKIKLLGKSISELIK